jgi:RNA polymerase sigma-70 factor, ECF subfamily
LPNKPPSFDDTVTAELPVMYRVARRLTLNPADAEDLVGQVLLLAARSWFLFDGRHPRSWLLKILRNEHLAGIRRTAVRPQTVPLDWAQEVPSPPSAGIEAKEANTDLLQELDNLPEEYRLAVALCDVEEMSYRDAALAMEVPVGTVRSRLFRGRQMLRERLGDTCS